MKSTKQVRKSISRLDRLPSGVKKKGILKHEAEPMVLMPSDAPENITQYSIDIPSMNKDRMLDEMDMLKNITVHLNQIVLTMEDLYKMDKEVKEEGKKEEEALFKREREDLVCFLIFCSQLTNQIDSALHEEKQILESLLKWFEKEVQIMEELGEDEIIPDWQVPVADKNITENINKLVDRIQRLEDLKGRVQELPKYVRVPTPRDKRRPLAPPSGAPKDPKNILEELATKHASEDVMNMMQVFQDDSGTPQTIETMNNRMIEIMKIFERQTNKLHRVTNEQDVLEGKLQKIQHDFRKLAEEKEIMEDELQKMKSSDTTLGKASGDTRKKLLAKLEKEKLKMEETTGPQPEKRKSMSLGGKRKDSVAAKMRDDLAKAQANIQTLEKEKKMLEDKLQKALQEAGNAKGQFADIPPNIPDWDIRSTALAGTEKDLSKKIKTDSKMKDRASVTDGTVPKAMRFETVKSGETLPGKGQEISTAPQVKDGKGKKKGTDLSEIEHDSLQRAPSTVSEKLPKQPGKSEISSKADSKGVAKSKESGELKKRRSTGKGTGKEPQDSADRILPPSPQEQEEQLLPVSPVQQAESVESTSEKQKKMFPTSISSTDLQQSLPVAYTSEEVQAAIAVATVISTPIATRTLTSEKAPAIPGTSLISLADSIGLQAEDITKGLIGEGMQQLVDHLKELEGIPEAEELTKLLLQPSKGMAEDVAKDLIEEGMQQLVDHLKEMKRGPEAEELTKLLLQPTKAVAEDATKGLIGEGMQQLVDHLMDLKGVPEAEKLTKLLLQPSKGMAEDVAKDLIEEGMQQLVDHLKEMKRGPEAEELTKLLLQPSKAVAEDVTKGLIGEGMQQLVDHLKEMKGVPEAEKLTKLLLQPSKGVAEDVAKRLIDEGMQHLVDHLKEMKRGPEAEKLTKLLLQPSKAVAEDVAKRLIDEGMQHLVDHLKELKGVPEAEKLTKLLLQPTKAVAEEVAKGLIGEGTQQLVDHLMDLKGVPEAEKLTKLLLETRKGVAEDVAEGLIGEGMQHLVDYLKELKGMSKAEKLTERLPQPTKGMAEDVAKDLIDEGMQKLVDHLTEMKGMPEAEKLTKLLLQPSKGMETLSNTQKLQLINQLTAPEEQQEAQLPIPGEEGQIVDEEQREKKRHILANIASTLNLLDQTQVEDGQTEEEVNEIAKMRRILLADLESNLKDLQQADVDVPTQQDLENDINELTQKRSLLISALESNLINLKEARAIAATQPSEVSQNKVKELLQDRTALTVCLEANDQELQEIKSQKAALVEKVKHEEVVNELSEKRKMLLEELEQNLNDLQEAQSLAAVEPSAVNDEKIKELTLQRETLAASLDTNLQDLERAQAHVSGVTEENRLKEEEINELSEKRKTLLDNLKSNLKDLQEAQFLAAIEPSAENDEMMKELTEQRKLLTANLETNLQDLQRAQGYVPGLGEESILKKLELNEQSEKKRLLQERLESNLRDLQHVQMLAAIEPDSVNELKLQELIEERKYLTRELETSAHAIEALQHEQELSDLSQKKQLLLKNLESNLKDLQEAQAIAAAEPGSIAEQKLQELTEQRRLLAADLDETLHHLEELQHQDKKAKSPELELQQLSDKKELLLGKLESTLKELQQAQALTPAEAGSVGEQKVQELIEQRRQLTAELEAAIFDMQEIQLRDEILKSGEKEVNNLLEKKQLLLKNLVSTVKELQEAQAAEAAQPGSISEDKLQVLREKGRHLSADLEVTGQDIKKAQHRAAGKAELVMSGKRDLSERKQFLLQNLTSNLKEFKEVQALVGSEPDSLTENEMEQLNEQRKLLSANLDTIIQQIKETENCRVPEIPKISVGFKMDLNELFEHKKMFVESLESNLKDLQAAQTLAATHPGNITEQKVRVLTDVRRLLASGLKTIMEEIDGAESQALEKDAITKTREIILEELYQKQRLILENLDSNQKDLQQAEALAAAQPDGMGDAKIKELTEQRRLLASALEGVMQDIREAEGIDRDKLELLQILEAGLVELTELRTQLWKNVESNLSELKDLQALEVSEPDGVQEEKRQMLAEQINCLTASLEALLQDMEEAQNLVLSGDQITTDERNLNDLFEIKRLETKLDEIEEIGCISDIQLDSMKGKLCELKTKRGLDKWDRSLKGPLSLTKEELAISGLDDETAKKLLGEKRTSPYLQKSIKDVQKKIIQDLQQKSLLLQEAASDEDLYKPTEAKSSLEKCLVSVPLKVMEDDRIIRYGADDELLAKRRALAAKLEANVKALKALYEVQQMRNVKEKLASKPPPELLKKGKSGLPSYISKAIEVKKLTPWQNVEVPTDQQEESETSIQLQPYKLQKKDMGLELKKYFMQHLKKTSTPHELTLHSRDMQEMLDYSMNAQPGPKANLPQVFVLPQTQLQQANLIAAQKLLYVQPGTLSTARFHDYSQQPPRPAWAGSQLPVTNYLQKLVNLKKKLLNPEMKGLLETSSSSTTQASKPAATEPIKDSMLICGKAFRKSRHGHHS